jgi:oxygen-dependent protoporphyrinogen oxidase
MVVNLYYSTPDLVDEPGFGYLIPRSIPLEQNPECALGVIFDTYSTIGQDIAGTKVTVMLGGHWWDGFNEYPSEEEGAEMARRVLERHLGANFAEKPDKVLVGLNRECIPQYVVGHEALLQRAHHELMSGFKGRLSVAGTSYGGVGFNDCVRGARDVVLKLKRNTPGLNETTGLEHLVRPRAYVDVKTALRTHLEQRRREGQERREAREERMRQELAEMEKQIEKMKKNRR